MCARARGVCGCVGFGVCGFLPVHGRAHLFEDLTYKYEEEDTCMSYDRPCLQVQERGTFDNTHTHTHTHTQVNRETQTQTKAHTADADADSQATATDIDRHDKRGYIHVFALRAQQGALLFCCSKFSLRFRV